MTDHTPTILGFDSSSAACKVALLRGDAVLMHRVEEMAKGQAERLMTLCSELMRDAGIAPSDLTAIGVGTGPGNFTGIRISVSAARGLALGLGVPALGVTAFEALQYGQKTACSCAVDARRDEAYLQAFDASGQAAEAVICPAANLPMTTETLIGHGGAAPAYPTAIAICRVAGERLGQPQPRPAPVYIRPADAAPARDAPPVILP
ncbi:MAG: tRNA (adenosine(37)-N6)-threonylcarbamoyltransferase complex dimerization subunit type 1 TsaB [Pseudomonadota bacterium]